MKRTALALTLVLTLFLVAFFAQQVNLTKANFGFMKSWYCDISISSPQNMTTYDSGDTFLNFTVETNFFVQVEYERYSYCYFYNLDEQDIQSSVKIDDVRVVSEELITNDTILDYTHTILKGQANVYGLPLGLHSIKVFPGYLYANGTIDQVSLPDSPSSATVYFTFYIGPPIISGLSVENKTYNQLEVPLDFLVNKDSSWMGYSLDEDVNATLSGNTTLTLKEGVHSITIYANDTAGNTGASETIYFTIDVPEPFPTLIVATASGASAAIVGIGLLFYFKKHKH